MAKNIIITLALLAIITLLAYIAIREQPITSTPTLQPIEPLEPTPRAPPIDIGTPTPRAPDIIPTQPGAPAELVFPQTVTFWVNDITVPTVTSYELGVNYIPVKEHAIKTFAGSFGQYFEDPTPYLRVVLCSELYKQKAAPACELVPIIYRDNYVSFARGYQFDEYIGGLASRDYLAYYTVYSGDTIVATSNKAVIRTVRD